MKLKIIIFQICFLLFSTVMPSKALVEKEFFKKNNSIVNILCPFASLDLGLFRKVTGCAAMCSKAPTCRSFFYNKQEQFCKGAPDILSTTFGCEDMPGTSYYQSTDCTITTSTPTSMSSTTSISTTTSMSTTTTTSAVLLGQYADLCTTDADCTLSAGTCLQGACSCIAGYRYEPSSGSCVINCVSYGSTYIEYLNKDLAVAHTAEYFKVTLMQCETYCSTSDTCRGVNYSPVYGGGMCRLKSETPYTDPNAFQDYTDVHYYTRNCA